MKIKNFTLISLVCIIFGVSFSIQAAENNEKKKITRITSDRMEMNWSKNVAIFIGNALLVDEDGRVEADRMEVFLVASEEDENKEEDIEKVIATGNVKITTPERRTKSGKAVFHKKEDILILYDNPEVWQKGTCFTGGRITFDLKKDTMIIDKDVQGSLESKETKTTESPEEEDADITDKKSH
ncbi:MAG: LptA/OstA family protein [bacterium]|nr:LptA/OstA family protein [bacterium]